MGIFSSDEDIHLENADLECEPQNEYVTEKNVNKLDNIIDPGEKIHYLAVESGGNIEIKGRNIENEQKIATKGYIRTAATNKRVVSKIPYLTKSEEISLRYDKISSVGFKSGIVQKKLVVETSSQTYLIGIGGIAEDACKDMLKFIRKKSSDTVVDKNSSESKEVDPLEQIQRLKDLNNSGAISDEEFKQKKTELLDKL